MSADLIHNLSAFADTDLKMPTLFVGHGSPMNAIEDNEFSEAWMKVSKGLPIPKAIICVSAHWQTVNTQVTAMESPKTIHDFQGFPPELYEKEYPAKGSPDLANLTRETVKKTQIGLNQNWGLDHGTWSVLCRMFPDANIPVIQISLDYTKAPAYHYELSKELTLLRKKGVLIIGSGNIVHNLRTMVWEDKAYDWATNFDEIIKHYMLSGDHNAIINYPKLGQAAQLAVPTNEHFLPLLYVLGLQDSRDEISFFGDKVTMGSMSMRSVKIG
jgi:4,5-DOPA dioxygenase extradiol